MGKPASLAVPAKPADEAPEATPRTIEGGPLVEPDAYGIYHAANTPVGHRGSRGSRAGFTAAGASDNRAEQLLISQMQTPERQRAGQSSYLVASPLPNMSSPRLFSSPNPVPLFHPSPKRHGLLQSPGQHATGFESLFQSPMRGYGSELQAAAELLRFETPSRQPALESLLSPSPSRHNNRRTAPGSQGRRGRAVAFDVADWRQGPDAALGDTNHGLTAADDADFDLVKNLLQSPGPKEVQQLPLLQHEQQRSKLGGRSSSTGPGSPWGLKEPAEAAKPPAHVRRRALDFSKAESMHRDLQVLPSLRRGGRHGGGSSSCSPVPDALSAGSLEHSGGVQDIDQQRQLDQKQSSKFQPDLPLLPLDLSECERHNPSSTTGLTPTSKTPSDAAALQRQRQRPVGLLVDPFTSPRTALDAAAAVVAGQAMDALLHMHGSSQKQQQAADAALRSMAALPSAAFEGLSSSSGSKLKLAGAAAASPGRGSSNASLPAMVPVDGVSTAAAAGAGGDTARNVLRLFDKGTSQQQQQAAEEGNLVMDEYLEGGYGTSQGQQQEHEAADEADGHEGTQGRTPSRAAAAASAGGGARSGGQSDSKRSSGRQQGKKAAQGSGGELQPSRRSRRIARSLPAEPQEQRERTASPPPRSSGSAGRTRRTARRTAEASTREDPVQQQLTFDDTATDMDVDQQEQDEQQGLEQQQAYEEQHQAYDEQQQVLAAALEAAAAAAAEPVEEAEQAEAGEGGSRRTRSRSSSRRSSEQKSKGSRAQQQQQQEDFDQIDAAAIAEADAAAAVASLAAAGLDPTALAQSAAYLPGLQQLAQMQMLQNFGVTPDKRSSRLTGGLLGPGTPDDVRMAHVGMQFAPGIRSCHCKKSQCLKLYCDCFANNTYCSGCACLDCKNVEANAQEVLARRVNIQQRDPNAFTHKLAQRADTLTNRKGCKCKKSHCLKKYCECFQLGVRCGDLCKCSDCHNVDLEGSLPLPNLPMLQRTAMQLTAGGGQQQQRMQHAAAASAPFWPLGQTLPAVSTGAATPSASLSMASAQAQLLLRLQGTGPGTPGSASLVNGLLMQHATPQAAAAAAVSGALPVSQVAALTGDLAAGISSEGLPLDVGYGGIAATPLAAVAATPQPPKSAGAPSAYDKGGLRSTAKPLLPQFLQAAAAAAAGGGGNGAEGEPQEQQGTGGSSSSVKMMVLHTNTAADGAALGDEQLPTPDQAGAEHHLQQLRGASSDLEASTAAAAAAAAAAAHAAAAAAAAAAQQQYDAAALAALQSYDAGLQQELAAAQQQQHQRPGFISSPIREPSSRLQPAYRSPLGAAGAGAAASSSSGGDSRMGPVSSAVPGSVGSKARHRLASSSRAQEDDASTEHMQQQQQSGLAALVPGAASHAVAHAKHGGQLSNARRQLLQQIQEEAAGLSDLAALPWAQQQQTLGADSFAAATAAGAAAGLDAAAAGGGSNSSSPGQPVMLGPGGPMVMLPRNALRSAMNQSAAALNLTSAGGGVAPTAAAAAAAGDCSSAADQGEPRQTAGMLMTVVDEYGSVQYYFLPNTQGAAPADTQEAGLQQQQQEQPQPPQQAEEDKQQQQQPQEQHPTYALRSRAHKSHPAAHSDPMQVDHAAADATAADEQPQQQQQQHPKQEAFMTPTKAWPPAEGSAAGAADGVMHGRSMRSNSEAAGGGGSCRVTPQKRTTPNKRKADGETLTPATSPDQVRPSPAKLPHQLSPLGTNAHQASPSQPVVLSPVKLAPSALPGAFSAAAAAALSPDSAPRRSLRGARAQRQAEQAQQQVQQQKMQQAALPAQQQEMQLFLATTADGQQLLLRAPAGTDPQSLIAPDGSVQSCYLAAVIPNTPLASPGPSGAGVAAGAAQQRTLMTQQQQQQQEHCSPVGRSMKQALQVDLPPMFSSPSKVMMSPGDPRAKEAAGFLRCSPGRTVFSPKGSSPSKPILGQSPGRSQGSYGY